MDIYKDLNTKKEMKYTFRVKRTIGTPSSVRKVNRGPLALIPCKETYKNST